MPLRPALPLAALLLASCTTARLHVAEVELRLDAPAAEPTPGDTVPLVATLRNATPDTLAMEFATACWLAFHVRAADGRSLHESRAGEPCGTAPARIVLAPGEERRAEARWVSSPADSRPLTAYLVLEEHHLERGGRRVFKAGHRFGETTLRGAGGAVP